ncbi:MULTISPECIES: toxin-antitoxin system [Tomitella]|uniref:Toxin-antitoxin system n=2 Tax=Tomitella TaxID=741759 RepID=A0A516X924_9ACTN|nr:MULTISPECIES: toxin-antitoxin system [Tomitella]QDQ99532.1 toxin-antitoxin system [Tomitella fengzijianii]
MAMPSKGQRSYIPVRLPVQLLEAVERARANEGVSSRSQYVADVLAEHLGAHELVEERGKQPQTLIA